MWQPHSRVNVRSRHPKRDRRHPAALVLAVVRENPQGNARELLRWPACTRSECHFRYYTFLNSRLLLNWLILPRSPWFRAGPAPTKTFEGCLKILFYGLDAPLEGQTKVTKHRHSVDFNSFSVLWHCLGDRKGIWLWSVKKFAPAVFRSSSLEDLWQTWSNLE